MRYISVSITAIFISAALTACRIDHPDPIPAEPTSTIRLNIDHNLERVEEGNQLLTIVKGAPNDIYAVQIYKRSKLSNTTFNKYAYGIFDNPNLMSVELKAEEYYKIEMTMIPNATTIINRNEAGRYHEPFIVGGSGGGLGEVTNTFDYSIIRHIGNIDSGYAMVNQQGTDAQGYNRPPISRFYGVTKVFEAREDMQLTIDLKWVVFGLTVIPEDFTAGSIEIEMEGAPKLTITTDDPTSITRKIFTLYNNSTGIIPWCDDDYTEDVPTIITLTKADGSKEVLRNSDKPIVMKRRVNKILLIQCGETGNDAIIITSENESLTDSPKEVI